MKATNTTQQSFSLWGWLTATSLFSFFYSFFTLFFSSRPSEQSHPEDPIYAIPFPNEVTLSSVQQWLKNINFEATLDLAEQEIKQKSSTPTTEKIQKLQKITELVRLKMPELPNCQDWTPITNLLKRVGDLAKNALPQTPVYLPILDNQTPSSKTRETFGLGNWVNDCFMNATLQMIFSSPWLVENIIYGKGQNVLVLEAYQKWEDHYEWGKLFKAPYLANPLRALNKNFEGSGQHDATEFLMALIQPLKKEDNPLFFSQQTTTFYEGAAAIKTDLKEDTQFDDQGGKKELTSATSLEIILPKNQENLLMENLIQQTFNEQLPEDASEISFEKRDRSFAKLKPQRKETKINPPPYLFVDVKRHGYSIIEGPYKINEEINFQDTFTIPSECTLNGQKATYRWISFALHSGDDNSGHYVAYVHDNNGYHYYSDARKETRSQAEFLQEGRQFYLGFAQRIDSDGAPKNNLYEVD